MKKIGVFLSILLLCIAGVFAYTPSTELQSKIDEVVEIFEDIIDIKGEPYRTAILSTISTYMLKYEDDERVSYILTYLYNNLESSEETDISAVISGEISQEFIETYYADSLVGGVGIVDCTLSGGTQTECYKFTVAPDATTDHEIGPWCPTNISQGEIAGGIWPDDGKIYQVSGDFVENLSVFYSDNSWELYDSETGDISVTDTQISCEGAAKPNVEEEYQNHCVECSLSYMTVPNMTYTIPVNPVETGTTNSVDGSIGTGVAFNGIKFDASAPTAQILAANTIAPFDDCGGHINLNAGYHYHETTGCSKEVSLIDEDESMIGLAFDGVPMFTQASDTSGLDTCGGHTIDGVYHYHVSETGSNQFLGCYAAEYGCASSDADAVCDASSSSSTQGPGQGGDQQGPPSGEDSGQMGPPPGR